MRYRIHFTARRDEDFTWETDVIIEAGDLLSLIFQTQIAISNEYEKIIKASQEMIRIEKEKGFLKDDDDIPF